jgi:hypothetical protein
MSTYKVARTVHYAVTGGRLRRWQITHRVLEVIDGGPCHAPVELLVPTPDGDRRYEIACRRRVPSPEQCDACRIDVRIVEEHRVDDPAVAAGRDPQAGAA